ncbi:transcriptional regulator YeiL [Listeria costaricensis]|uniref:transcriptional regulator YeiL n=1 Tax=Listeria costaricensis TaxID=2026604 RepID=UPI000C073CC2|nr:transcriptional regulator YeiL [Listeria costaricensis]
MNQPLKPELFSFDVQPYAQSVHVKKAAKIMTTGEKVEQLYYLVSGQAKIVMFHENGKRSVVDFLQSGSFIGEIELLQNTCPTKDVIAMRDCQLIALPLAILRDQLLNDPLFLRALCLQLSHKALKRAEENAENGSSSFRSRLARFILTMSENGIYQVAHTDAADYLHVSYRHFLYVFHDFLEQGLLQKEGKSYYLASPEQISQWAHPQ